MKRLLGRLSCAVELHDWVLVTACPDHTAHTRAYDCGFLTYRCRRCGVVR